MSAKTWNPLSPSFRARNSMKFQQKSESTTNFQQLNHGFSDPKFKFVASQKLALNTSQTRVDEPNLKDSRRLPSSKKKKISKTPCPPRVDFFSNGPNHNNQHQDLTPTPTRRWLQHPPWKNASASSAGWGYSIHSSASKREKYWWPQKAGRLAGWQAGTGWSTGSVKVPSCWALLEIIYFTSRWWEGGGIFGGRVG